MRKWDTLCYGGSGSRRCCLLSLVVVCAALVLLSTETFGTGERSDGGTPAPPAGGRPAEAVATGAPHEATEAPQPRTVAVPPSLTSLPHHDGTTCARIADSVPSGVGRLGGVVCFRGRSITTPPPAAGEGRQRRSGRELILRSGRSNVSVSADEGSHAVVGAAVRAGPTLIIDACLSVFHALVDSFPAAAEMRPGLRNVTVVLRSNCHVFHFGVIIFAAALVDGPNEGRPPLLDEPEALLQLASRSSDGGNALDVALARALRDRGGYVTRQPSSVQLRVEDSAYGTVPAALITMAEEEPALGWCSCGTLFVGERVRPLQRADITLLAQRLAANLPLTASGARQLWGTCRDGDIRVLLILRRNSRFLARPAEFVEALRGVSDTLCVRAHYFDELAVVMQYHLASSCDVMIGVHGAALTWVVGMAGQPSAGRCAGQPGLASHKLLVELWFVGKLLRSMRVYEKLAHLSGVNYTSLQPVSAWFYRRGAASDASRGGTQNVGGHPSNVTLLPGSQWLGAQENERVLKMMRRYGHPQRSEYFSWQSPSFSADAVTDLGRRIVSLMSRGCSRP